MEQSNPIVQIVLASIAAVTTIVTSYLAFLVIKLRQGVEQVHIAVNSERTTILEKVDALQAEIRQLSSDKAVLKEQAQVQEQKQSGDNGS